MRTITLTCFLILCVVSCALLCTAQTEGPQPNLREIEDWISSHAPVVLSTFSSPDGGAIVWSKSGATDLLAFKDCDAVLTISSNTTVTRTQDGRVTYSQTHWTTTFSLKDIDLPSITFRAGKQAFFWQDNGGYILEMATRPNAVHLSSTQIPFGKTEERVANSLGSGAWLYVSTPDMAGRLVKALTAAAKACGAKSINKDLF